ncbi:hypothetical protein MJO28_010690 [Puccinia striiformis f. sp. tritici]|uniref:Uncharacterized protein n=1 Tax=Puccinia striiformis f. sp. tritici TaxID=168172 RepID=A0ACC0E7D7_9BASI|nr:hypothetical protein MJO28_010690 [Puccinia striiformis f. sp. tritici]
MTDSNLSFLKALCLVLLMVNQLSTNQIILAVAAPPNPIEHSISKGPSLIPDTVTTQHCISPTAQDFDSCDRPATPLVDQRKSISSSEPDNGMPQNCPKRMGELSQRQVLNPDRPFLVPSGVSGSPKRGPISTSGDSPGTCDVKHGEKAGVYSMPENPSVVGENSRQRKHSAVHVASENPSYPEVGQPFRSSQFDEPTRDHGGYPSVPDHHYSSESYPDHSLPLYQLHYWYAWEPVQAYGLRLMGAYLPVGGDVYFPSRISSVHDNEARRTSSRLFDPTHPTHVGTNPGNTLIANGQDMDKIPSSSRFPNDQSKQGFIPPRTVDKNQEAKWRNGENFRYKATSQVDSTSKNHEGEKLESSRASPVETEGTIDSLVDEASQLPDSEDKSGNDSKAMHPELHSISKEDSSPKRMDEIFARDPRAVDVIASTITKKPGVLSGDLLANSPQSAETDELLLKILKDSTSDSQSENIGVNSLPHNHGNSIQWASPTPPFKSQANEANALEISRPLGNQVESLPRKNSGKSGTYLQAKPSAPKAENGDSDHPHKPSDNSNDASHSASHESNPDVTSAQELKKYKKKAGAMTSGLSHDVPSDAESGSSQKGTYNPASITARLSQDSDGWFSHDTAKSTKIVPSNGEIENSRSHWEPQREERKSPGKSERGKGSFTPSGRKQGIVVTKKYDVEGSQPKLNSNPGEKIWESATLPQSNRFAVLDGKLAKEELLEAERPKEYNNFKKEGKPLHQDMSGSEQACENPERINNLVSVYDRPSLEHAKNLMYNAWDKARFIQLPATSIRSLKLQSIGSPKNLLNHLPSVPFAVSILDTIKGSKSKLGDMVGRYSRWNIQPRPLQKQPNPVGTVLKEKNDHTQEKDSENLVQTLQLSQRKALNTELPTTSHTPAGGIGTTVSGIDVIQVSPACLQDYTEKNCGAKTAEIESLAQLGNLLNVESKNTFIPITVTLNSLGQQRMIQLITKIQKGSSERKQLKWILDRIGIIEGKRRWKAILRQVNQPEIVEDWAEEKKKLEESFGEISRLDQALKLSEYWPTFYDSKEQDSEWLSGVMKIPLVKKSLYEILGEEELDYRMKSIDFLSKRKYPYNWLHPTDLQEAYRQGLNTNLIICVGDIFQFGNGHLNVEGGNGIPANLEASISLWLVWGNTSSAPWGDSAAKAWFLNDPKRSELYQRRYGNLRYIWKNLAPPPEQIVQMIPPLKEKFYPKKAIHKNKKNLEVWWNFSDVMEWQEYQLDPYIMWKIGCDLKLTKERDVQPDMEALQRDLINYTNISKEMKTRMKEWFELKSLVPQGSITYDEEPHSLISDIKDSFGHVGFLLSSYWKNKKSS